MSQPVQDGAQPPKKKGGCMGCSWACIIPAGCLGVLFLGCAGVGGFFYWGISQIKKAPIFAESVKRAKENPEVQAQLGTPIEEGWMIQGNINYVNGSGSADFTIPISGPNGSAKIHVVATAVNDKWTYTSLSVVTDKKEINLLRPGEKEPDL
ncbi:MAG TPA: cytochrome c oxidase assembly factor Coa1 family protein [Planctomycetota bacterium]|nr:cytochrome c oxidase assembly factor Coa1 family protein [Planctomycetota bacterium]